MTDPVTRISTTNHAANSLATTLLSRDCVIGVYDRTTFPDETKLISCNIGTVSAKIHA